MILLLYLNVISLFQHFKMKISHGLCFIYIKKYETISDMNVDKLRPD